MGAAVHIDIGQSQVGDFAAATQFGEPADADAGAASVDVQAGDGMSVAFKLAGVGAADGLPAGAAVPVDGSGGGGVHRAAFVGIVVSASTSPSSSRSKVRLARSS